MKRESYDFARDLDWPDMVDRSVGERRFNFSSDEKTICSFWKDV